MSERNKRRLNRAYAKYRTVKNKQNRVLAFFRAFIPEIIFRTTKIEGEPVTRKMVSSIFK